MSIAHKVNGSWQKTAGLPPVDSVLSSTSQNPLENRQIYAALADKITASVANLVNYYKKSETYTQAEVRQLIGAISTLSIKVVAALPTTDISATTIYWVGPDATTGKYDQYIYADNAWVKTGDTSVNLGDYVTTEALELAIADFLTEDDVEAILASYYTKTEIDTLLEDKQDSLTFDNVPTENSANVVKSGGVYSAVDDVYKVMGQNGAKNLNIYPYHETTETKNGITFTDNGDGTITANGTSTAVAQFFCHLRTNTSTEQNNLIVPNGTYIISGCPSDINGAAVIVANITENGVAANKGTDRGNGDTFTVDGDDYYDDQVELGVLIYVYSGKTLDNVTFYPMIRLASDTDSTWQPYAKTNRELTEEMKGVNYIEIATDTSFVLNETHEGSAFIRKAYGMSVQDGTPTPSTPVDIVSAKVNYNNLGKNLNSFPYQQGKKKVTGGLTFVVGEDGVITMSGEKTTNDLVQYYPMMDTVGWMGYEINWLKSGCTYRLSGCPANGSSSTYRLRIILNYQHGNSSQYVDNGEGVTFTVSSDSIKWARIMIDVSGSIGADYGTQVFHPMLTLASADQTYECGFAKNLYTDLDLRAIEVASTDDYTYERDGKYYVADTLDWDVDKGYYITRRVGHLVFDGSERWTYSTSPDNVLGLNRSYISNPNLTELRSKVMSNYTSGGMGLTDCCRISSVGDFLLYSTEYTTVEDWKAAFAETNIAVDYIFATPEVSYLSPEQNALLLSLKTYDEASFIAPKGTVTPLTTLEYGDGGTIATYALSGHNSVIHQESWDQKNLLRYPYTHTSTTHNGVVYTNNGDGTITANGTASPNQSVFNCRNRLGDNLVLPAGTYIISDGVNRFNECYIDIYGTDENGDGVRLAGTNKDYGIFTLPKERAVGVFIRVSTGATVSNVIFKPMIRKAGTSETWVPYVKNNKEITQNISNPNLLDNGWFTINQRGKTSYTNSMNGFSVDRWYKNLNINLDIIDDGVRLTKKAASNPTLYQKIEASPYLMGKTVTLSVMTSDGKIRSCVGTFPTTFPSSGNSIICNYNDGTISFRLQAVDTFNPYFIATLDTENCAIDGYVDIRAAKLELGTVSTLAMDAAPNYQQELSKCQRYFNIIKSSNNSYKPIGFGYMDETTSARIAIPLSVPMRANPTIVISDLSKLRIYGEAARGVSEISVIDIENNIVHLTVTVSTSGTKYSPAILADTTKDEYISFSADL